jgi:hypothetical protein
MVIARFASCLIEVNIKYPYGKYRGTVNSKGEFYGKRKMRKILGNEES